MDAIAGWVGEHDPGAERRPLRPARVHRLPLVARRVPGLRRLRLLPDAPPDRLRVVAADARGRRAHRRARPRLRRRLLPRPPREAPCPFLKTSCASAGWPCATGCSSTARRTGRPPCAPSDGSVKVASGPKPRVYAFDDIPGVRGLVRLGEAFAVIPLVKRGLPEAKLAFENPSVIGVAAAASVAGALIKRARPGTGGELGAALIGLAPAGLRAARRRARRSTTASSTRRSPPTRPTTRTRRDAAEGARALRLAPDGADDRRQPGGHAAAQARDGAADAAGRRRGRARLHGRRGRGLRVERAPRRLAGSRRR